MEASDGGAGGVGVGELGGAFSAAWTSATQMLRMRIIRVIIVR
ncbi:MAG: hypothetical protein QOG12_2093 [Verrucomicrobiota bacterium]